MRPDTTSPARRLVLSLLLALAAGLAVLFSRAIPAESAEEVTVFTVVPGSTVAGDSTTYVVEVSVSDVPAGLHAFTVGFPFELNSVTPTVYVDGQLVLLSAGVGITSYTAPLNLTAGNHAISIQLANVRNPFAVGTYQITLTAFGQTHAADIVIVAGGFHHFTIAGKDDGLIPDTAVGGSVEAWVRARDLHGNLVPMPVDSGGGDSAGAGNGGSAGSGANGGAVPIGDPDSCGQVPIGVNPPGLPGSCEGAPPPPPVPTPCVVAPDGLGTPAVTILPDKHIYVFPVTGPNPAAQITIPGGCGGQPIGASSNVFALIAEQSSPAAPGEEQDDEDPLPPPPPVSTVLTLSASPNPSVYGNAVGISAVLGTENGGSVLGTLALSLNGEVIHESDNDGTPFPDGFTLSLATPQLLQAGVYDLVAVFTSGDTGFSHTSAATQLTVEPASTLTSLRRSGATLIVEVETESALTTPTGTVELRQGDEVLHLLTLVGGSASLPIGTLPPGEYTIRAHYTGDGNHSAGESQSVSFVVPEPPEIPNNIVEAPTATTTPQPSAPTVTTTPQAFPTPSVTATPTTSPSPDDEMRLALPALAGEESIMVTNGESIQPGDTLLINRGGPNEETVVVGGVDTAVLQGTGSAADVLVTLKAPLSRAHAAGEPVGLAPAVPEQSSPAVASPSAPSPTPTVASTVAGASTSTPQPPLAGMGTVRHEPGTGSLLLIGVVLLSFGGWLPLLGRRARPRRGGYSD